MGGHGLSRDDVIKAFGLKEFQKGFAYYSDGSILMAISDKKIIHGKVQGSMDRPYDVEVRLDDLWASTCSCPVGEMCKHCAAVAIAYADGKISSADDIKRMVFSLSEKEAKDQLIKAAMQFSEVARDVLKGPEVCKWLGSRLEAVSHAFEGCQEGEEISDRCVELKDLVEGSHNSGARPDEVLRFTFAVAVAALDALDEFGEDPYEDLEGLILCNMSLFVEAVDSLAEGGLDDAFEETMSLFGRDWKGIGVENMPLTFALRLGADRVIKRFQEELRRDGPAAPGINKIRIRILSYQAHMIAHDTEKAIQILLDDGASDDDRILAATTWALQNEWGKARNILESGEWSTNKRERAHMLLSTYYHQAPEIDLPAAREVVILIEKADGHGDDRMREMILNVLRRTGDDDALGSMVAKARLTIMTKAWLLAKLGRWDDLERTVREYKALNQSDLWKLAEISTSRKDICTMLVMRALKCKDLMMTQERTALVKIAFRNLYRDDLNALKGIDIVATRIDVQIAQELASRFPEESLRMLNERVADLDPQRLADLVFLLKDEHSAYELGETWLKRKLTVSPRYDRIRAALMAMRCRLNDAEWRRLNDSLSAEFPGRSALKVAFVDVGRITRPVGNSVPMVWDDRRKMRSRRERYGEFE